MLSSVAVLGKVVYIPGERRLVEHKLCASECTVYSLQDTRLMATIDNVAGKRL